MYIGYRGWQSFCCWFWSHLYTSLYCSEYCCLVFYI